MISCYDVAVIGYGPTGATAANLLGGLGLNVVVIERDPDVYGRARAISTDDEVMRIDDLRHPIIVTRGQTVTMLFHAPGVELTAMGRAMGEGGVGDTVMVQNPASFRMIAGVVTAPGTVVATGPASPSPQQRTARN